MKPGVDKIIKDKPKLKIETSIPKIDIKLNRNIYQNLLKISESITLSEYHEMAVNNRQFLLRNKHKIGYLNV